MPKAILQEIEKVNEINGWMGVNTMAEKEMVTVQAIYYRIKMGLYKVVNLNGIILVKKKDVMRLRRREEI